MIRIDRNMYIKEEKDNVVSIATRILFYDFNFSIKYEKGDEDFITFRFRIKKKDFEGYYYLVDIIDGMIKRKEYVLSGSNSFVFKIGDIPDYEELIIDIIYEGKNIKNKGNIYLDIFTRKF